MENPDSSVARAAFEKGQALAQNGQFLPAIIQFEIAVASAPQHADAHIELAYAHKDAGQFDAALAAFEAGLARFPGHVRLLNGRGLVLKDLGRKAEALAAFRQVSGLDAAHFGAYSNAAAVLFDLGQFEAAASDARRALQLRPGLIPALTLLARSLFALGDVANAYAACEAVVEHPDDSIATSMARAAALQDLGRHQEALDALLDICRRAPGNTVAHMNAGISALRLGREDIGWKLWEARWDVAGASRRPVEPSPEHPVLADTDTLAGKTLFIYGEQGFGDSIQFVRYMPELRKRGAQVLLGLPHVLTPLYEAMPGIHVLAQGEQVGKFDAHCALMSIPGVLGLTHPPPPPLRPWLSEAKRQHWAARLGPRTVRRVGLALSGNPDHSNDLNRSIPVRLLRPLFETGCEFVSIQKAIRPADQEQAHAYGLKSFDGEIADFQDVAALIDACDLIISVDSAPAHLTGSMGKELWLLIPYAADWRWGIDGDETAWYPGARLFRQTRDRQWNPVIDEIVRKLR